MGNEFGYLDVVTAATSRSVVASLVWAVRRVWLTYWRVVLSFSAMVVTERPLPMSAQMVFWLWLRGEETEQPADNINTCKQNNVYRYLRITKQTPTHLQKLPFYL